MNTTNFEAPGGRCPMCGTGKLLMQNFRTWTGAKDAGACAKFVCKNCRAEINCSGGYYAVGLAQAWIDYNAALIERFRENIGGFQFSD